MIGLVCVLLIFYTKEADATVNWKQSKALMTIESERAEVKQVELCRVDGGHKGENSVSVRMTPDNKRSLYLTPESKEEVEVETEIQCLGKAPSSCKKRQCEPCPCELDPHSAADKYVQMLLKEIEPRCHAVPAGQDVRILLIGLGGGAALQHIFAKCPVGSVSMHVVEIDARVIKMAKQYFGLPQEKYLEVEHADATQALKSRFGTSPNASLRGKANSTKQFDVAFVDCMAGAGRVPLPCRSAQFIELLHKAVRKDGLVIQNIWHYSPTAPEKVALEFSQTKADYMRIFGNVDQKRVPLPADIDWQDLLMAVA